MIMKIFITGQDYQVGKISRILDAHEFDISIYRISDVDYESPNITLPNLMY